MTATAPDADDRRGPAQKLGIASGQVVQEMGWDEDVDEGLRESVVIVQHALRNALIPVVTLVGLQAAFLLGGAVVTETMFSWPGVGRLAVGAIVSSDFPTAQGAIMILAIAFLSINLIVDVLYVYLDPRVQRA